MCACAFAFVSGFAWLFALGSWLLALGSWLLALGSWLLALGSWLLALGSWLLGLLAEQTNSCEVSGAHVAAQGLCVFVFSRLVRDLIW